MKREADLLNKHVKESVQYSLATHAIEKMKPSREAVRLCAQVAAGSISANQAVEKIKRSYGVESTRSHG
jgi:hypothetical protein